MCVCVCVAELDRKRAACKQQAINITDWALRPSAYPSVTESDLFDGALHVCVCVCGLRVQAYACAQVEAFSDWLFLCYIAISHTEVVTSRFHYVPRCGDGSYSVTGQVVVVCCRNRSAVLPLMLAGLIFAS